MAENQICNLHKYLITGNFINMYKDEINLHTIFQLSKTLSHTKEIQPSMASKERHLLFLFLSPSTIQGFISKPNPSLLVAPTSSRDLGDSKKESKREIKYIRISKREGKWCAPLDHIFTQEQVNDHLQHFHMSKPKYLTRTSSQQRHPLSLS